MIQPGPSLEKLVNDIVESKLQNFNTVMPGIIEDVDVTGAVCNVKPLLKKRYKNGVDFEYPVIANVPIVFYRAGNAMISLPIKRGDLVMLLFCQRSLDGWLAAQSGESVDPKDSRKFDLTDAIALPGLYPFSDLPQGADPNNLVIRNGQSQITLTPAGAVISGSQTENVNTILKEFLQEFAKPPPTPVVDPNTGASVIGAKMTELITRLGAIS